MNMPYSGRGQYGIEAASRAYFGKPAKDLLLHQVAFIVALINKPALPDRSFATDPLLISITRDDALQDVLARAVDLTLQTYLARHPNDADNDQLRRRSVRGRFHRGRARRSGQCQLQATEVRRDRHRLAPAGSTFKIFTYGGLVEQLTHEVLADKSAPGTVEAIAAKVLERCSVLDAPIEVLLGRGRGVKKIENFHSRSEPQYRSVISCRIALGESRNTAAMRAGACRDQERDRAHVSPGNAQRREAPPAALPDDRNRRIRGQSAVDGVDDGLLSTVGFA